MSISSLTGAGLSCLHVANRYKRYGHRTTVDPLLPDDCHSARQAISRWSGYAPTPLESLDGFATQTGVDRIFLKNEAPRFDLGSFKALGGAYAVSVILLEQLSLALGRQATLQDLTSGEHQSITRQLTVSCATDGNHGRSVAWGAQRFHCACIIYIHSEVSDGRKSAIEKFGAEVIRVDGNYDESVRIAALEAEKNNRTVVSDTSYPGYLDIPADVMRGYTVLADEALEQMGDVLPTHVFLQAGVGGFAAAIAARVRDRCSAAQPRIILVEPDQADCLYRSIDAGEPVAVHGDLDTVMAGLACGEVSLIAFDVLLHDSDDVLLITDDAAIACMRLLADGVDGDKPLVCGESGVTGLAAAALASADDGLRQTLAINSDSRFLVIGTEGATDPEVYEALVGRSAEAVG